MPTAMGIHKAKQASKAGLQEAPNPQRLLQGWGFGSAMCKRNLVSRELPTNLRSLLGQAADPASAEGLKSLP